MKDRLENNKLKNYIGEKRFPIPLTAALGHTTYCLQLLPRDPNPVV